MIYIAVVVLLPLLGFLLLEVICFTAFNGYAELGPWAFRRRTDGTFSLLQIVAQILLIVPPLLLCLYGLAVALMQFFALFAAEIRR